MGIIRLTREDTPDRSKLRGMRRRRAVPHLLPHAGDCGELLDAASRRIQAAGTQSDLESALDQLITLLRDVRMQSTSDEWTQWRDACREHSLRQLLHEDPFTRRAYEKPRGYAGDAVLLDYIYGSEERWAPPEATPLGRMIFDYTTRSPAPEGVRSRRAFIARTLDQLAERRAGADVLSIAAGHFREALLSVAVKRKRLGRVVALDADPASMELVDSQYGCLGVETHAASIRRLFTGKLDLGRFDLVYSTGLFDYLGEASSRRLVSVMFQMLKPRGRLLVANFLPGVRDVGYMETFMDWRLVYRTRHELMEMTAELEQDAIDGIRIFAEENQNIIFLEIGRAG